MPRRSTLITYVFVYLFAIGSAFRILDRLQGNRNAWLAAALLAAFLLLLGIEPWLSRRSRRYTLLYPVLQTGIVITLAILPPHNDVFASLFFSLTLQSMYTLPPRIGLRWVGIFTVIIIVSFVQVYGFAEGLSLAFIYGGGLFFMGSYAAFIRQAETAREESRKLTAELQVTHQELQSYTEQVEELAVLEERNRLARNLHDSVTQTIFSMTLTAEAARLLFDRDPSRVEKQLSRLQDLAKSALREMRSRVVELRPSTVAKMGLIPALRHHITSLERQHGLSVGLSITGEPHLTDLNAERLFRIVQEALNNVLKHAQTDRASVFLQFANGRVLAQIEDHGIGFAPEATHIEEEHLGLTAMRERAEMMGGVLTIHSRPGEGTRLTLEITSINEEGDYD